MSIGNDKYTEANTILSFYFSTAESTCLRTYMYLLQIPKTIQQEFGDKDTCSNL